MKIKFTKSPVGAFLLAYFENDVTELSDALAEEVIDLGYGIEETLEVTLEETTEVTEETTEEITEEVKPKRKK
jgi:hypothetical protein